MGWDAHALLLQWSKKLKTRRRDLLTGNTLFSVLKITKTRSIKKYFLEKQLYILESRSPTTARKTFGRPRDQWIDSIRRGWVRQSLSFHRTKTYSITILKHFLYVIIIKRVIFRVDKVLSVLYMYAYWLFMNWRRVDWTPQLIGLILKQAVFFFLKSNSEWRRRKHHVLVFIRIFFSKNPSICGDDLTIRQMDWIHTLLLWRRSKTIKPVADTRTWNIRTGYYFLF